MLYIGSHVGFNKSNQLVGSVKEALSYGANTFMFYTGAPQNTTRNPIIDELTLEALSIMKENNMDYSKVIVHAPYIMNLCNEEKFSFSVEFLTHELERVNQLGIKYLVLHPGSHVGQGIETGINRIIEGLNMAFQNLGNNNQVTILLETMAGKGTEVGTNIQELKKDLLEKKNSGAFIMSNGFNNLKSSVENLFNIFTAHKAAVEQIFSENFEKFSIDIRDLSEKLDNYDDKSDSQVEIFDLIKEGLAKLSTETSLVKFELEQNYRDGNEQQLEKIEQLRESILSIKSDIDETYGNIKESIVVKPKIN